ncbi:hypothetical protein ACE6H2_020855 [Prunus campanulata]
MREREREREREARNAMCTSGTQNQKEASFALFAKAVRPKRDESKMEKSLLESKIIKVTKRKRLSAFYREEN